MLRLHAVVETPEFLTGAKHVLNESERVALIDFLAQNPMAGDLMQGTGGARKVRWAAKGKGKSGGARVVTFYAGPDLPVFLLAVFGKGERANISKSERNELRADIGRACCGVQKESGVMSKSGQSILRGARQARAYAQGAREGFVAHVPQQVDVAAIRKRLGLSQHEFATRFGFKLDAVQNWEQGRRKPEGAARALLRVIEREPAAVQRALAE